MTEREPLCEAFDAVVDFFPPDTMPDMVYGLIKLTFDIVADQLVPAKAVALNHDIRQPDTAHPLAPGSDFWPLRAATDIIVRGKAFAPGGRPTHSQMIRVTVGQDQKLIAVYGDRRVEWSGPGQLRFTPPEPYEEMPVVWNKAYGGWDGRVPVEMEPTVGNLSRLELDHPGAYPRNPFGKGYVVVDEPAEGIMLPNLEDPQQLLRPETLVAGDPRRWYLQPLPVCYEYTNFGMFPRYAWLGIEAWYPPPADAPLRELLLGQLPDNWKDLEQVTVGASSLPPLALQEGPMGMVFTDLDAGTPIIVEGMHAERPHVSFPLPPPPKLDFYIEGKIYEVPTQLMTVVVMPNDAQVTLTYVARSWDLPRTFIPGIHSNIPLALLVNGEHTVPYDSQPSLRDQVKSGDAGRPGAPKK